MKQRRDYIDKMLEEVTELGKMRRKEGEGAGKTCHDEVMATVLLLLLSSVRQLKTGVFMLLGVMLALLINHALI